MFFAWLLLFLVQTLLMGSGLVVWHRRLGIVAVFLLALMLPLGYETTIAMIRRGYDLSGDQYVGGITNVGSLDAQTASVFNLVALAWFAILAICALCFRARPAVHVRQPQVWKSSYVSMSTVNRT